MPPASLLQIARSQQYGKARNTNAPTPEELELCRAYAMRTVSLQQVALALEMTRPQAHSWIKTKVLAALRAGIAQLVIH